MLFHNASLKGNIISEEVTKIFCPNRNVISFSFVPKLNIIFPIMTSRVQ